MNSPILLSSGDVIADRRFEWARDREAKGDITGAADLLLQVLELAPTYASAWFVLGELRQKLGDRAGSIETIRGLGYRFAAPSPTITRPVGGVPRQYSTIRFAVPVDLHNGGIALSGTYDAPSA